jgi:YidC/Oxa1 family membrane protein insertase
MILLTTLFNPTSWLLEAIHNFVGNWGWSIIVLTILINLIIIPFRAPLKKNASRLKKLEPSLITIREKLKDDPYKLNKATNELYRNENYNPLFGCTPYLTLPLIYFPLYWGIWSSLNIIGEPWVLWIKDLSTPDPYYILPIIFGLLGFLDKVRLRSEDSSIVKIIFKFVMFVISMASIFFPAGLVLCWVTKKIVYVSYNWILKSYTSKIFPQPIHQ